MSERAPRGNNDRLDNGVDVRILRFKPEQRLWVRTLASSYCGLFTHWHKGRGHYCAGADECPRHREALVWKGYTPVEWWEQATHLWIPAVLEITESLDGDMKPKFRRGQVWEIGKGKPERKGQVPALRGALQEQGDAAGWPEPFSIKPILVRVYHVIDLRLDKDNPIPFRVMMPPSQPAPRADQVAKALEPGHGSKTMAEWLQKMRAARAGQEPAEG